MCDIVDTVNIAVDYHQANLQPTKVHVLVEFQF